MIIKKLIIKNFKCWCGDYSLAFDKYTCFIGENSTGKSAIQEAIIIPFHEGLNANMLCRERPIQSEISLMIELEQHDLDEISAIISNNFDEYSEVLIKLFDVERYNFWKYLIKYNILTTDLHREYDREIPLNENYIGLVTEDSPYFPKKLEIFLKEMVLEEWPYLSEFEISVNKALHTIARVVNNYLRENIIQIKARRSIEIELPSTELVFFREFDGSNVKTILFNAKFSKNISEVKRFKIFQEIVGNWSFTPGIPDVVGESGQEIRLIFRENGDFTYIDELGDGVKEATMIAAVTILYPRKIFLVEEPELHQHPRAIRELRNILKSILVGQIILSTHSPIFLGDIDDSTALIKVNREKEEIKSAQIDNKQDLEEFRNLFNLKNSDILFDDILVVVEGITDYLAFTSWFETLFPNNYSVQFLHSGGKSNIPYSIILLHILQLDHFISTYFIIDKDKEEPEEIKNTIIDQLKKSHKSIVETIGETVIRDKIYVLKKKRLEEYFENAEEIIAKDWSININDVREILHQTNKSFLGKIKHLAKQSGKIFKKSKDIPKWAKDMEEVNIDPEIIRLLESIRNLEDTSY